MQFLADDRDVSGVAALAADVLGEPDAEQSGRGGPPAEVTGQLAGPFPTRRCSAESPVRRRCAPTCVTADVRVWSRCSPRGSPRGSRCAGCATIRPAPWPAGSEACLVGHALAEDAVDDEVDGADARQQVAGDRQIRASGSSSRTASTVSAWANQRHCRSVRTHTPMLAPPPLSRCGPRRRCPSGTNRSARPGAVQGSAGGAASDSSRVSVAGDRHPVPSARTAVCGTSPAGT